MDGGQSDAYLKTANNINQTIAESEWAYHSGEDPKEAARAYHERMKR